MISQCLMKFLILGKKKKKILFNNVPLSFLYFPFFLFFSAPKLIHPIMDKEHFINFTLEDENFINELKQEMVS